MWKRLFLLLGICFLVAADNVNLGVSIRKKEVLRGVKACLHAFTQVNIINSHPSDSVTITSIKAEPERTYFKGSAVVEPIPQQLHLSVSPKTTLGPGQLLTVPINFLPRYPHDSGTSGAPQLSSYQSADFKDLVGDGVMMGEQNNFRYSNEKSSDNEYEVRTEIRVETSRGRVVLPVTASSVRYNDFHVPERIQFFSSSSTSDDAILYKSRNRHSDNCGKEQEKADKCYEVYVRNPNPEPLVVLELLTSRPDLVSFYDQRADPQPQVPRTSPSLAWDGSEKIIRPYESSYVATVCPIRADTDSPGPAYTSSIDSPWFVDDGGLDISMGHMLIRTNVNNLLIWLERYVDMRKYNSESKLQSENSRTASGTSSARSEEMTTIREFMTDYLVPEARTKRTANIPIRNAANDAIKIMRLAIVLEKSGYEMLEKGGLYLDITSPLMACGAPGPNTPGVVIAECEVSELIEPGNVIEEGIQLEYGFKDDGPNSYFNKEIDSNSIKGGIVARAAADAKLTFTDWKERIAMRSTTDVPYDSVLEIPFDIKVVGNQLTAITDGSSVLTDYLKLEGKQNEVMAFFFPFSAYDMRMWNAWHGVRGRNYEYDRSGIAHSLRIVGYTHENLTLTDLGLESDNDDPNSFLCERFYAAVGEPMDGQIGSFRDLGHIALSYDYSVHRGFSHIGIVHPVVCYLTYKTYPIDTGDHSIMLVIFPGSLELSASSQGADLANDLKTSFSTHDFENSPLFGSTIHSGMAVVERWYQQTVSGRALEKYLREYTTLPDPNGANLLRNYLYNVASVPKEEVGLVDPIVVNVGAIARGETKNTPIYITNHNPVPVQLFLDRSEVEGMSLSVERDGSHVAGEGNYVLDYLPKTERENKVEKGRWKGHNREALRRFLGTTEYAAIFFLSFMYRDQMKPNPRAMKRLDILKDLYKLRAKADFIMDPFSFSFFNDENSACAGTAQHPAMYSNFNTTFGSPYHGPTLISDDLRTVHHLVTCEPEISGKPPPPKDLTNLRHAPVTIPPGGTLQLSLKVQAPGAVSLEKDITQFVGTGLVLSTDHGQIIPVIVTFEALLGQLMVPPNPKWRKAFRGWQTDDVRYAHHYQRTILQVPSWYFVSETMERPSNHSSRTDLPQHRIRIVPSKGLPQIEERITVLHPFEAKDLDLYLTSSFSRDVVLRDIQSCNPRFQIELDEQRKPETFKQGAKRSFRATKVGKMRSKISCPSFEELVNNETIQVTLPVGPQQYPSFFQCALEWLTSRPDMHVEECGLKQMRRMNDEAEQISEDDAITRATDALKRAVSFTFYKYNPLYLKDADAAKVYAAKSNDMDASEEVDKSFESVGASLKAGSSRRSEVLDRVTVDLFAEVTDAWRVVSELDLHTMSTSLRATVEYEYSRRSSRSRDVGRDRAGKKLSASASQTLTVPLQDTFMRSHLSIPRLVKRSTDVNYDADTDDSQGIFEQHFFDTDFYSVVNFPPTPVAETASIMIPLQNPTPHPIKVKLATATWEVIERDLQNANSETSILDQDGVRDNYMSRFESIFPQTGKSNIENTPGEAWWDGPGAFYQADGKGNLIQSRHNDTIATAHETHVSLENPSLFSHSSFIVGCGNRCGQRDETVEKFDHTVKSSSSIGAAAASGFSLVGKSRQSEEDEDGYFDDGTYDAYLSPGAEAMAEDAPAAFAIPYSSFDEIVLPPFSSTEVGPVLFRPPGRYSVLGCDAVHESGVGDWQTETAAMCASKVFETLVFLENSLTGLERVVLRGKALWGRIVFFDEAKDEGVGAQFSDLEYRYGRSALLFPGTSIRYRPQKTRSENEAAIKGMHPILKTIKVANLGDFTVEYSTTYLSVSSRPDAPLSPNKASPSDNRIKRCSHRGFTLYGCHENDSINFSNKDGELMKNLWNGFKLEPNETMSITIEHVPDCVYKREFVSLHLIKKRPSRRRRRRRAGSHGPFLPGDNPKQWDNPGVAFQQGDLELLIGYDMNDDEAAACIPYAASRGGEPIFVFGSDNVSDWNTGSVGDEEVDHVFRRMQMGKRHRVDHLMPLVQTLLVWQYCRFVCLSILTALVFFVGWMQTHFRFRASKRFLRVLKNVRGRFSAHSQSKWAAGFRCLARSNPTASELQTIGKEQNRLILLPRLKSNGAMSPHCINSSGVFQRERSPGMYGVHSRAGRESSVGTVAEKESLFQTTIAKTVSAEGTYYLPCGLGSKAAISRGMISRSVKPKLLLKSKQLYEQRQGAQRIPSTTAQGKPSVSAEKDKKKQGGDAVVEPLFSSDEYSTEESYSTERSSPHPTKKSSSVAVGKSANVSGRTVGKSRTNHADRKGAADHAKRPKAARREKCVDSQPAEATAVDQEGMFPTQMLSSGDVPANPKKKNPRKRLKQKKSETSFSSKRQAGCDTTVSSEDSSSITSLARSSIDAEGIQETIERISKGENIIQSLGPKVPLDHAKKAVPKTKKSKKKKKDLKFGQGIPHSPSSIRSSTSNISHKTDSTGSSMDKLLTSPSLGLEGSSHSPKPRPPPGLAPPPGFRSFGTTSPELSSALSPPLLGDLPGGYDPVTSLLGPVDEHPPPKDLNDRTGTALGQLYSTAEKDPSTTTQLEPTAGSLFQTIRKFDEGALDVGLDSSSLSIDALAELRSPALSDINHHSDPPTPTPTPMVGSSEASQHVGVGEGFNVMDFLDNILEEPRASEDGSEPSGLEEAVGDLVAGDEVVPALPLLADPWGVSEARASRATMYGIVVEDGNSSNGSVNNDMAVSGDGETSDEIVQAVLSSFQHQHDAHAGIISPASIFPAGTSVFDDKEDGGDDYNDGDYYAKLLG